MRQSELPNPESDDSLPAAARGIGYRRQLASALLAAPSCVDFIEVVAESCFADRRSLREAAALRELWPVIPHGVKLSLGRADGIDPDKAARLGTLARELRAPLVTEHVALTSTRRQDIGHLTPIPRTEEAVRVVAKNVARARRSLPDVPLLLENIAVPFSFGADEMSEPDFYARIAESTGCDLLLDVANLYANAVNTGLDPVAVARQFPLERVGMVHLAGGVFEDGFYLDTHAHPVPAAVFDVLAAVFEVAADVPVVLERDAHIGGLAPLLAELALAQARRPPVAAGQRVMARRVKALGAAMESRPGNGEARLADEQEMLAGLLLETVSPDRALAESIGAEGIMRARRILDRKRVEDALSVLARLSQRAAEVWSLAEWVLRCRPRVARMQAIADALAITEAVIARAAPAVADEARRDRLVLRARFVTGGAVPRVRLGPFVAREVLSMGSVVWAAKGFGGTAVVAIRERRAPRTERRMNERGE